VSRTAGWAERVKSANCLTLSSKHSKQSSAISKRRRAHSQQLRRLLGPDPSPRRGIHCRRIVLTDRL